MTAALRIGFSQAWRALVAAEMIGAAAGVGWMVQVGGEIGNARQVLLGIALLPLLLYHPWQLIIAGFVRGAFASDGS